MKIGIYGGSFNPPHLGHLHAAISAARFLKLDELLLIPAGIPPHKQLSENAPEYVRLLLALGLRNYGMEDRLDAKKNWPTLF